MTIFKKDGSGKRDLQAELKKLPKQKLEFIYKMLEYADINNDSRPQVPFDKLDSMIFYALVNKMCTQLKDMQMPNRELSAVDFFIWEFFYKIGFKFASEKKLDVVKTGVSLN
ncbi:hypothetical protein GWN26_11705 [Candidatus Saccharibacteria bacterium]|nr:hypothetical protein [Candidatus Saccharibacteria bacterium]NIV04166.1 hypothetical protein [Calditrichia bacterium]NIS38711.1 hypothetical protein [Candidatus Saccharibacteria bacterium]NIV72615.1 hypothetical protein [Calditrichia bacterium]NIV99745.1 hypothetical protein [Candidatus Saccharibacteria bacterium]